MWPNNKFLFCKHSTKTFFLNHLKVSCQHHAPSPLIFVYHFPLHKDMNHSTTIKIRKLTLTPLPNPQTHSSSTNSLNGVLQTKGYDLCSHATLNWHVSPVIFSAKKFLSLSFTFMTLILLNKAHRPHPAWSLNFRKNILPEHSYIRSFTYCLRLIWGCSSRDKELWQRPYGLQNLKYLLPGPL